MGPGTLHSQHTCPACSRFMEAHHECPYCGLESPAHPRLRLLQLTALTMCITGLCALLLIGLLTPPHRISISDIRPVMNYGHVTLSGTFADHDITIVPPKEPTRPGSPLAHPAAHHPTQVTGHLYLAAGKVPRLYLDSTLTPHPNTATP